MTETTEILVFSDSHGNTKLMEEALFLHPLARYILHLGDGLRDIDRIHDEHPERTIFCAAGNNDWYPLFDGQPVPYENNCTVGEVRILMAHGHRWGVSRGTDTALQAGRQFGADIVCFGHTHEPYLRYEPGKKGQKSLYLFNPGSIREFSYGLITLRHGQMLLSHGNLL